jgi:ubiquinone/menaquinone biosynthesis C-methylase UbiE
MHAPLPEPSPWLRRWAHLIRPGGTVLDLACGSGRHLR